MNINSQVTVPEYICWTNHIGILALVRILILRISCPFQKVRYITVHSRVQCFCDRFLKAFFRLENVYLINHVSAHEEMMATNKTYEDAEIFIDQHIKPSDAVNHLLKFVADRYRKSTIDLFIKQQIAVAIEMPLRVLNCIALHEKKDPREFPARNMLVMEDHYWVSHMRKAHLKGVWRISTYPNVKEFLNKCFVLFKLSGEIIFNLVLLVLGKKGNRGQEKAEVKIAVLHAQGANLEKRTDYFWFPDSGLKPEQVLVYFKYSAKPPTPETIAHLEKNHIPWVNLLPFRLGHKKITGGVAEFNRLPSLLYVSYLVQTLGSCLMMFFHCLFSCKKELWAYWKTLTLLLSTANFFEAFFRMYQVKGHFALHEGGRDMAAANLAIEAVGGVDFCTHWSSYDVMSMTMGKGHDVCFNWGPFFTKHFFSQPYYSIKNYIYSGYIFDSFFENCEVRSKIHRQRLFKEGVDFIICFFDQNTWADRPLWNAGAENLYRRLFELVLQDPRLGLILKPKKVGPKVKLPSIASLCEKAEATQRCLILEGDVFPNEASQASDLTIGLGVSSTSAVESALAGVRTITYDLENNHEHPFYKGGYRNMVFDNLDEMFHAMAQFRRDPKSLPEFGNYSLVLPEIDPFLDRKASRRVGQYMFHVINSLKQGKNKEDSIKAANAFYRAQYGQDKVVEKLMI